MIRIVGATLLFFVRAAAQQLTVELPAIPGIELVGPQSPEFETLVTQIVGPERPMGLAASLPFGVIIRNKTSQGIAAIDTVWTVGDQILLNAADQMFGRPILFVKPDQAVLAVPAGILQNPRQMRIFSDGRIEGHRLNNFRNPGNVTISVDAVVFESGQFAGGDRYGAFERWDAQIEAPRNLATAVLQKQSSQSIGEIASWLEGLAAAGRRPLPAEAHASETILAAVVLLGVYRGEGEAALYSRAKGIVDAPVFPLHR